MHIIYCNFGISKNICSLSFFEYYKVIHISIIKNDEVDN